MQSSWMSRRTNGIRKYLPGFSYSIHGHPFPLASGWLKNGYGTQGMGMESSPGQWVRRWQLGLLGKVLSYLRRWAHFFLWRNPQNCCILVPTYLRKMYTHGKGPSRGNVGAVKQPPNLWCLELALPLDLYCWGVIHHLTVEAGLNLALLLLVAEIILVAATVKILWCSVQKRAKDVNII